MGARRRLDVELVRRELAPSRAQARLLIESGSVRVGGAPASNVDRLVAPHEPITIVGDRPRFVGRGGEKLDAAIERFGLDVVGKRALDVGASTGGFTDCLLQRGVRSVVSLDVGRGQLHESLRGDERVDVRERTNIRHVTLDDFGGEPFELITADVSFISLRLIAAVVARDLASDGAELIMLIKPQFEAGKSEVSRGRGVVRDAGVWRRVIEDVVSAMSDVGAATMGVMVSPLLGADGNVEFLGYFRAHGATESGDVDRRGAASVDLDALMDAAVRHAGAQQTAPQSAAADSDHMSQHSDHPQTGTDGEGRR